LICIFDCETIPDTDLVRQQFALEGDDLSVTEEAFRLQEEKSGSARGSGAVDAAYKAIESVVHSGSTLLLYSVNSITSGTDAQGEVGVRLECDGRIVNGHGADTDIVIASAKAYVNTLNKLAATQPKAHPQLEKTI